MENVTLAQLGEQAFAAVDFLIRQGHVRPGGLLVMGCSTSEISGGRIGKHGSPAIGEAVVRGAMDACQASGVQLAVQCCEHLNRALVLPREAALARGYAPVSVVPYPTAGGAAASAAYRAMKDPVVVEAIQADAGLDIGDTLIGMHLRPVAVPLRPDAQAIGLAHMTMAYTRPKYIGGPRAQYTLDER